MNIVYFSFLKIYIIIDKIYIIIKTWIVKFCNYKGKVNFYNTV